MEKKTANPSIPFLSRRTGIDRRWITTIGHYPERRSGKDRRSAQHRSFLEPIDSDDQADRKIPFPDIVVNTASPQGNDSDDVATEKTAVRIPETVGSDDTTKK
jgi:hypothetical protein